MNLCGVLNVDKPAGLTSRDVVNRIVQMVKPAKVGHAGTLDPLATGVLVVCVGHATRLIPFAQEGSKRYVGRFLLGKTSDTDDITGDVTDAGDATQIERAGLEQVIPEFVGTISQVPPRYSAIHVQGRRAYQLARRGESFDIESRTVDVSSIQLTSFQAPEFELEIVCGGGTYIRSIGRDIGQRLGCGAVMTTLRRLAVGQFQAIDAIELEQLARGNLVEALRPASQLLAGLWSKMLTNHEVSAIRCGQSIRGIEAELIPPMRGTFASLSIADDNRIALVGPDEQLLGVAEFDRTNQRICPRIVFPAD